jgi:hypothetical protein
VNVLHEVWTDGSMQTQRARELGFDEARLAHLGRTIERERDDGAALLIARGGGPAARPPTAA